MRRRNGSAARVAPSVAEGLRALPSIDQLLGRRELETLAERAGRSIVTQAARRVLGALRAQLKTKAEPNLLPDPAAIAARVAREVEALLAPSLRPLINATGVVLHTNLGRAPLSPGAIAAVARSAGRYSNLEYSIGSGVRGKRDVHTADLLAALAGAEAAIVVNNNAAAVLLVLNTLAKGAEVVVSRGELIEIGDGFRIPEIMSESGAILHEVGTTNRTRLGDYQSAIDDRTRLLLRVHPSNFQITGFTERPSLEELVALGRRTALPVYEDLGSGCLADLSSSGIKEPLVRASCQAGAALVSFSGDKLLGGPQAGIIAGRWEIVERLRRNPLFRALRVDKLTTAALEETLRAYQRGALDEIPTLRMIRASSQEIARRAAEFVEGIGRVLPEDATIELQDGFSVVGGGSTPDQRLPTCVLLVASRRYSSAALEQRLRTAESCAPVIARIEHGRVVFDLRTVAPEQESELRSSLISALA